MLRLRDFLQIGDDQTAQRVMSVLSALPVDVLRFVFGSVTINAVGDRYARGQCISPIFVAGRWLVTVAENAPEATIAHELAHAYLRHVQPGLDVEREAAATTAAWGFGADDPGGAADPEAVVARCKADLALREHEGRPVAKIELGEIVLVCSRCDGLCPVAAPVVPELWADGAAACEHCGWGARIVSLDSLAPECPKCKTKPRCWWAVDATSAEPRVVLGCECEQRVLLLRTTPNPVARDTQGGRMNAFQSTDEPEHAWAVRRAFVALHDVLSPMLRNPEPEPQIADGWCAHLQFAEGYVRRAARVVEPGPEQERLEALATDITLVRIEIMRGALARAVSEITRISTDLKSGNVAATNTASANIEN
jgi:hypothetical protein